jgi:hypothetical protein
MKQALLLSMALVISIITYAQEKLTFSEVVTVDSTTKDQLFDKGREWFVDNFKDSKNVLEVNDKATGELLGKGSIKYSPDVSAAAAVTGWITFSIKIKVKDGKYKYEIGDFVHEANKGGSCSVSFGEITTTVEAPELHYGFMCNGNQGWRNKVWNDMKAKIDLTAKSFIASLNKKMNTKADKDF